jgi:EAL domain-containing protein (putative c-di-GMP-specific phosphodiesterase class I)
MPVTAEGVETPAILQALQAMGQLKGQGYLYGKPEDAAATRDRLAGLKMLVAPPAPASQGPDTNPQHRLAG